MRTFARIIAPLLLVLGQATTVSAADFDQQVTTLIRDYDAARYDAANDDARIKAYEALILRADDLAKQNPTRGEPLVWKGSMQAEQAGLERSLSLVKQARKTLEAAVSLNPNAYAVDAYSTLGAMYAVLPGFPLSFGDKKKARECYEKALTLNSSSLRANLNYAQLLLKVDDYSGALKYARIALTSPPLAGRDKADKAARASAESIVAKAIAKQH
jgi:tetratricopeptide (TPR) repeat protein